MSRASLSELAINGGPKTITEPLPGWPQFTEEIIQAATGPLRTGRVNYWTGEIGMQFEKAFAEWCGVKFAVTTTSGTSALHVAVASLGIGPGDEVITPSYTFIASSFCVCQAGAVPVFADVERGTHCIDPGSVRALIGPRTKAVIAVHLYGNVCDMDRLVSLCREHEIHLIEDCAQAHGATWKGRKVGTFGIAGCFSFCQSKTFTTGGEGGAVVTDDEEYCWTMRSFRDHGYDVRERMRLLELEAKLPYIHTRVGYNYRMTEFQSAIGLKELERIDRWNLPRRRRNGQILIDALSDCPQIQTLPVHGRDGVENGFFVFPIVLNLEALTVDKKTVVDAIAAEGAPVGPVFWPQSYKERAYLEHSGFGERRYPFRDPATRPEAVQYDAAFCPNAAWLEDRTFITLVHPTLEEEHMRLIASAVLKVCRAYAK